MKKWIAFVLSLVFAAMIVGCGQTNASQEQVSDTIALGLGESYVYEIDEGEFSSYVAGKVIAEDQIGSKIGDVTLTAGWRNNTDGTTISRETLRGEVYAIDGVSKKVAVALKFLDKGETLTTTHYYVILNPDADLTDMEAYVIAPLIPNNPGDE